MAETCWWYYISKFTEFFDTLFFLLRKKNQHVSTLHVIHHGVMPFSGELDLALKTFVTTLLTLFFAYTVWMGMKFAPGGHSTFFAMLNAFVHIVMYFYYMIAAMGPKYQKYIWWKKYLTAFQMVCKRMTHKNRLLTSSLSTIAGSIRRHLYSSIPTALDGLRVSKGIYGVDWPSRHHVLIPLLGLLQAKLHREAKKTESCCRETNANQWKTLLQRRQQ